MVIRSPRSSTISSVVIPLLLATAGAAQRQGTVRSESILVPPDPPYAGLQADIPQPPKAAFQLPSHRLPPLPQGRGGLPEPVVAPTVDRTAPAGVPLGGGGFQYFMNRVVQPAGASRSNTGEPSAAVSYDTAIQTGNWYAGVSTDAGMTWTHVNPATRFPAADLGFCCDQRVLYVPSRDVYLWLLQYSYSAATQTGRHRLVVIQGRDNLRSMTGLAPVYQSWSLTSSLLGFANGTQIDFPDLAFSTDHLYGSANVYDGVSGLYAGSVVWRVGLDDLINGGGAVFTKARNDTLGSSAYRFCQGSASTMYFGGHVDTNTLRIFDWADAAANPSWVDRDVTAWSNAGYSSLGPDGRDWLGRADWRIHGAYANGTELGFLWMSGPVGTRTRPFTRVARFRTSDRVLLSQPDIWSASYSFGYPAACSNGRGDIGLVLAVGGGAMHPHTSATVVDAYQTWPNLMTYAMTAGNSGTTSGGFGDYFTLARHPYYNQTFVGTGMAQNGGAGATFSEPRYAWFGRDESEPAWLSLAVQAAGAGNNLVPITLDRTDRQGSRDGTTPFTRGFVAYQDYALTAPATHAWNGNTYGFDRWAYRANTAGAFVEQPLDQRTLAIDSIGLNDDGAEARYVLAFSAWFAPSQPVPILVDRPDLLGQSSGIGTFRRTYRVGTQIQASVPTSFGNLSFYRWKVGTYLYPIGQPMVTLTLDRELDVEPVFGTYRAGSTTVFGRGCPGSNGLPTHQVRGTPDIGNTPRFELANGPRLSVGVLYIGYSNTSWNGVPLPFLIPGTGCQLANSPDFSCGVATDAAGAAAFAIPLPSDTSLIGGTFYTSYVCADPTVNPLGATTSNGVATRLGGWTF